MRRVLSLLVLGFISLLSGPLAADQVVLRDGRTLETKKPPVVKGRQAVLTLQDGKLVSIPAAEIDVEKTAALARKVAATPKTVETPVPSRAPSLVDAARASQNARKAAVVLTDQDVAGGYLEDSSDASEKGDGEVTLGPTTTTKGDAGYAIEGSVLNSGQSPVLGVTVTIEAFGAEGKSIATTFAALAKDSLDPGEKATFRAQIGTDKEVERFTYVPRWKVVAPPAGEGEPGEGARDEATGETPSGDGIAAAPPPAPAQPETPPQRQPDMAAPPANAPVGAPSQPGGTYLPPPSSDQPKPPGGGA